MGEDIRLGLLHQRVQGVAAVVRLGFQFLHLGVHGGEGLVALLAGALGPFHRGVGFLVLFVRHVVGGFQSFQALLALGGGLVIPGGLGRGPGGGRFLRRGVLVLRRRRRRGGGGRRPLGRLGVAQLGLQAVRLRFQGVGPGA